jgi:hypothetical protein
MACLTGWPSASTPLKVVLARRELSLASAREELTAHFADLAARAVEQQRVVA